MRADLHIHSYFSDGKYAPADIVRYASHNHVRIISLTDHDTIAGLPEARQAIRLYDTMTFIPGAEFSTFFGEDELHILGYGIDERHPGILHLLERVQENRTKRLNRILTRLQDAGIQLTVEDVQNGHQAACLGRMHIAHSLSEHGHVRNVREAFDRYLSYDARLITCVEADFVPAPQAIEIILEAGGIPVFAHPTIALFDKYIHALIESGLQGVEVFKGSRASVEEFYLETVTKDKGLLLTGGSDWHGHNPAHGLGRFYVDSSKIQPFLQAVKNTMG